LTEIDLHAVNSKRFKSFLLFLLFSPSETPRFTPGPATGVADSSGLQLHFALKIQSSVAFQHLFPSSEGREMAKIRERCCASLLYKQVWECNLSPT